MQSSSSLKKEFLNKWIEGLHICVFSKKQMDLMERNKKIKLSADVAMASAKKTPTSWSNALLSDVRKNERDTILVDRLLGPKSQLQLQKSTDRMVMSCHKKIRCKKILKTSRKSAGKRTKKIMMGLPGSTLATVIAKRLVKKKTKVLKRLVPGGESMDEFSLIKEALDYILSLTVQVDVMRSVATGTEVLSDNKLLKSIE
ncbi:hypothetical protein L2E82_12164 [Cichorium intybus]|uniref:Uncharacterized protein n=1 Tax=Cichorium intybus TaxID=13427 RepID=A0ACB9GGD9_CICIN|nr:hypothetical protein L2E82_12164 [Cichorium intybus]